VKGAIKTAKEIKKYFLSSSTGPLELNDKITQSPADDNIIKEEDGGQQVNKESKDGRRTEKGHSVEKSYSEWKTLTGHSGGVLSLVVLNGAHIASCSDDKSIKIWDISTGNCLRTFTGHSHVVWSLAVLDDGARIASGSWDFTVKIWDTNTGNCLQTLTGHDRDVKVIAVIGDGDRIVSGSDDKLIKIWN